MPYLKVSDGTVYLEVDNPIGAWTPEKWAEEIRVREELLTRLQDNQPIPKTVPDQECLDTWNSMLSPVLTQIGELQKELAEMKTVNNGE